MLFLSCSVNVNVKSKKGTTSHMDVHKNALRCSRARVPKISIFRASFIYKGKCLKQWPVNMHFVQGERGKNVQKFIQSLTEMDSNILKNRENAVLHAHKLDWKTGQK